MKARDQRRPVKNRPYKRRIHFTSNEVWSYRVSSFMVVMRTPDNVTTYRVTLSELTGMSWDDIERGQWKKWWTGVGPAKVKDYIDKHFRHKQGKPS